MRRQVAQAERDSVDPAIRACARLGWPSRAVESFASVEVALRTDWLVASKQYSARQYFIGAGVAIAIGLVFTLVMFNVLLGPVLLVVGIVFLVIGLKKNKVGAMPPGPGQLK